MYFYYRAPVNCLQSISRDVFASGDDDGCIKVWLDLIREIVQLLNSLITLKLLIALGYPTAQMYLGAKRSWSK